MQNEMLEIEVLGPKGERLFFKSPASPSDIPAALTLFQKVGNEIDVRFVAASSQDK